MNKTLCFHHNDTDGRMSAAIVRYALGPEVMFIESDYDGKEIPWKVVEQVERILVVDFSFPVPVMIRLAEGHEFIWIDHHKSALVEFKEAAKNWPGLRDIDEAACVLTWRFFFPRRPVPRAVTLVGDRDTWRWAEADTGAFNEGLHGYNTHVDQDAFWKPLLEDDQIRVNEIITEGQQQRVIHLAETKSLVQHLGFEVQFEGYHTMVINTRGSGDLGQHGRDLGYKIVYCYIDQMQNDTLMTSVTLYSESVDVSLIANRFGGGGHAGAAGFSFPRRATPFPPGANVRWKNQEMPV